MKRTMPFHRRNGRLAALLSLVLRRRTWIGMILGCCLLFFFRSNAVIGKDNGSGSLRSPSRVKTPPQNLVGDLMNLPPYSPPPMPTIQNIQQITPQEARALNEWASKPMVGSFRYSPTTRIHMPWMDLVDVLPEPVIGVPTWTQTASNGLPPPLVTSANHTSSQQYGPPSVYATNEYAILTRKGCKPAPNQDRIGIVTYDQSSSSSTSGDDWWMGLFDGHGDLGHVTAQCALDAFPRLLDEIRPHQITTTHEEMMESMLGVFQKVQEGLPRVQGGATGISIWKRKSDLLISSVGDSSAMVFSLSPIQPDGSWELKLLHKVQPHKPDNPKERKRIEEMGGVVQDPPMPGWTARLFIPLTGAAEGMVTGLAMSRALGDHDGEAVGLSHVPDQTVIKLDTLSSENSYFVVLASDGIWDELPDMEVGKAFVKSKLMQPQLMPLGPMEIIEQLIVLSSERWKDKPGMNGYRDDISMAVHRLHLP